MSDSKSGKRTGKRERVSRPSLQQSEVIGAALGRLGLPDTESTRALLMLSDQTVSRLDRHGRVRGLYLGDDLASARADSIRGAGNVDDFVSPEVAAVILDAVDRSLASGEPETVEFSVPTKTRLLEFQGRCAPCGRDEVIWITRDRTADQQARRLGEWRAGLEAAINDFLQMLLDVDGSGLELDEVLTTVMRQIAAFFGASATFLDRFQGPHHVETVAQWRTTGVHRSPPGTSRGGPGYFPWAARQLARDPVLIVPDLDDLGPEASTDVENIVAGAERGFAWIRIGPGRRPTGLFGLNFDGPPTTDAVESYEPLIGFAGTLLAIVDRREEDHRRREQHRVFESIARGEAVETVLTQVCRIRETGAPGQYCVAWLADAEGRLHPVHPKTSGVRLDDFDPCPDLAPEMQTFRLPERRWRLGDGADEADPVAARFGATAVDLIPLVTHTRDEVVGVLAVYDTSRFPLDPAHARVGDWSELAASLAGVAIERSRDLARLSHRATHDSLTGLANRETFLAELERAIAQSGPVDRLVAVLYCDVDRFKEFNDRLGHGHGDRFLVEIGRLIEDQTRAPAVVARLGGDEFAILLEGLTDENDALIVAERIRSAVRTASAAPGSRASVSIGVAVSGSVADHAEGLLRDADIAMYQAKSSGRDRVEVFAERIRREAHARDELGRELRSALDSDDIGVHYQPMIDLRTGRLMGFEALARWRHPERGAVPPVEFIPIAEASGLIGGLGEVVLERSLEVAALWRGLDLHVNLSARQIDTVGYVERLLERIAASTVPVERVAMEITESVVLSESAPTVENLRLLVDSSVGLVLDDFGTGYASLTYLRRLPFRGIKVDRSFVSGIERSPDDAAIVAMVLALATTLGLEVIAEGVETEGQESRLREMGCRFVQGFRYSLPVPAERVPALLDRFGSPAPSTP